MVNREELTALLELVQAATGGSFELDRALSEAFGEENEHGVLIVADRWLGIAPLSTSIDAALALTERVLPRFGYALNGGHLRDQATIWLGEVETYDQQSMFVTEAATGPLAILATALSALTAQAQS